MTFTNNSIDGSAALPMLKISSEAMSVDHTFVIDRDLYDVAGGAPMFAASEFFSAVEFAVGPRRWCRPIGSARASTWAPTNSPEGRCRRSSGLRLLEPADDAVEPADGQRLCRAGVVARQDAQPLGIVRLVTTLGPP